MSPLEQITERQRTKAIKKVRDIDFLRKILGEEHITLTEYGPRFADTLKEEQLTTIHQVMDSYFRGVCEDLRKDRWGPPSIEGFVGDMVKVVVALFPHLGGELKEWEAGEGKLIAERYDVWKGADKLIREMDSRYQQLKVFDAQGSIAWEESRETQLREKWEKLRVGWEEERKKREEEQIRERGL